MVAGALRVGGLWRIDWPRGDRPHDAGAAAFDWAQDAARIRASLMSAYGLDWDAASRTLSFCDLIGLLASLMETAESSPRGGRLSAPGEAARAHQVEQGGARGPGGPQAPLRPQDRRTDPWRPRTQRRPTPSMLPPRRRQEEGGAQWLTRIAL
ncbi:MAG: hypothetical protein ACLTDR_11735 [Adlercreutzia equolifaciens]